MKRIERDGRFYRLRRGKLVEIPPEWVGRTVHPTEIENRPSKGLHKHRKAMTTGRFSSRDFVREKIEGHVPDGESGTKRA